MPRKPRIEYAGAVYHILRIKDKMIPGYVIPEQEDIEWTVKGVSSCQTN